LSEALNNARALCCNGRNSIPDYMPLDCTSGILLGLRELPAHYLPIQRNCLKKEKKGEGEERE